MGQADESPPRGARPSHSAERWGAGVIDVPPPKQRALRCAEVCIRASQGPHGGVFWTRFTTSSCIWATSPSPAVPQVWLNFSHVFDPIGSFDQELLDSVLKRIKVRLCSALRGLTEEGLVCSQCESQFWVQSQPSGRAPLAEAATRENLT